MRSLTLALMLSLIVVAPASADSASIALQDAGGGQVTVTYTVESTATGTGYNGWYAYLAEDHSTRAEPVPVPPPPPPPTGDCNLNATPATFSAQVSAATAGQVVCLATGDYGTWSGTNKAITVRKADGATPTMRVNFGAGDTGFTLDGMNGMQGGIDAGASSITIRNSVFTNAIDIRASANSDILLDANIHNNISSPTNGAWRVGTQNFTIQNSLLEGGDSDGIRFGGPGVRVLNNTFRNILQNGPNHTDMIQWYGGSGAVVRGNYFVQTADMESRSTQIMGMYDGSENNVIEDNVIDSRSRPWGIELYSDTNSIVRHNTLVHRPPGSCDFNQPCGFIHVTRKVGNNSPNGCPRDCDPGVGTQVYDNVAVVIVSDSSTTARNDHNVSGANVSFVGPLTEYAGFHLTSPKGTASDGLDVGIG